MKRIIFFVLVVLSANVFAQVPQKMSYQAIIRNNSNQLIVNTQIGIQVSILQGSASGTVVYTETQTPTTNTNGMISIEIGSGVGFDTIDWSTGTYFIKTNVDPTGGNNYTIIGTSELLSVPYALYSANGTPGPQGPAGNNGVGIVSTVNNGNGTYTFTYSNDSTFTTSNLTGPTGANGVGIVSTVNNGNGTYTFTYSNDSTFTTANLIGAVGPQGPAGPIAGSDKQIIFNNAGIAGASANLLWNQADTTLTITGKIITGNLNVKSLAGGGTKYLTTDNNGEVSAVTFSGVTGSGNNNYHTKWNASGSLVNSMIQDNGTSVSVNYPLQSNSQLFVYRQQITANGDGQSTIYGYRDRNSQNVGASYAQNASNTGVTGMSFWGDDYSFGVGGWNYNDYSRTGGVIGAEIYGNYWGVLGYKASSTTTYGAYATNTMGTGTGKTKEAIGIGVGSYGSLMGAWFRGDVYGTFVKGDRVSLYVDGKSYTNDVIAQVNDNGNDKKFVTYVPTSMTADVYMKGTGQMVNGKATVKFDSKYKNIISEKEPIIVTVTPVGKSNGIYLEEMKGDGFSVSENNDGKSNGTFTWIAVATRKGYENPTNPSEILEPEFDKNIDNFMFNENNNQKSAQPMWWDGNKLKFTPIPNAYNVRK